MSMSGVRRFLPILAFSILAFPAGATFAEAVSSNPSAADSVRSFISESHLHGIPYERAHNLGQHALPGLYDLLRDERSKADWWKVVITIGDIGSPASFDSLVEFMWRRFSGEISFGAFTAQTSTLYAIGSMPPDQRHLDYLVRGTDPEFWRDLSWSFEVAGEPEWFGVTLSTSSIAGLGLTGTARADSLLNALQKRPHSPGQVGAIRTALQRNASIQKSGRLAYEREIEKQGRRR